MSRGSCGLAPSGEGEDGRDYDGGERGDGQHGVGEAERVGLLRNDIDEVRERFVTGRHAGDVEMARGGGRGAERVGVQRGAAIEKRDETALAIDPPSCTQSVMIGEIFPLSAAGVALSTPTMSGTRMSDWPTPEANIAQPIGANGVCDVMCSAR